MKVTFRDICWFAVVALIFLYLSKCHRDDKGRVNDQAAELLNKVKQDSLSHNAEVLLLEGKLIEEQRKSHVIKTQVQVAGAKLEVSEKTINRLTTLLRQAKLFPVDTSFVTVSPEYVTYCDSLAEESELLTNEVIKYKNLSTG